MKNDEIIEFEDRSYVNPEVSLAEYDQFMEKFRNVQGQNQAQINRDTYNLGTQVPSNLGGLTGAEGLWNAQYQRTQVNDAIENLRRTGAAQAVATAMQNQQNAMANRLAQAQRAYNRAQQEAYNRDRSKSGSGSGTTSGAGDGDVAPDYNKSGTVSQGDTSIRGGAAGTSTVLTPESVTSMGEGNPQAGTYDSSTGKEMDRTGDINASRPNNSDFNIFDSAKGSFDYARSELEKLLRALGWLK